MRKIRVMYRHRSPRQHRNQRTGALLAETIVSIAVLVAVAVPAGVLVGNAVEAADRARRNVIAARTAEQLMNQVAGRDFTAEGTALPLLDRGQEYSEPTFSWKRTVQRGSAGNAVIVEDAVIVEVEIVFADQSHPAIRMSRVLAPMGESSQQKTNETRFQLPRRSY
ncbi:MAG: hypothetical protein MK102_18280 [Fuerstiella sp.]|nr:hypothetical protein [Fuerstiella sp.]